MTRLRAALSAGRPALGCWRIAAEPALDETLTHSDLDFMVYDAQHQPLSAERLTTSLRAAAGGPVAALVRVLTGDAAHIGQALDAGADGVIVPQVESAADAQRAVRASRFPPDGERSWGPGRAHHRTGDVEAFAASANADVVVIAQIESVEAVDAVDEILAVPGLTAVMVGPGDLAWSLGQGPAYRATEVVRLSRQVQDRCREVGMPFGIFTAGDDDAREWLDRGADLVNCSSDIGWARWGVDAAMQRLRPQDAQSAS